jgi:hypothetical protein
MTEAEWLTCADPTPMLEFLREKASDRKLRLFAVACCRLLMTRVRVSPMGQHVVNVAERYADAAVSIGDLANAHCYSSSPIATKFSLIDATQADSREAECACSNAAEIDGEVIMADCAAGNAAWAAAKQGAESPHDNSLSPIFNARLAVEQANQCELIGDIFGNLFRSVALDPAFLTLTVVHLAQAIYDNRAFDRMPALADALHEAGCDYEEILDHCRAPALHVRGCWALDLILGKL